MKRTLAITLAVIGLAGCGGSDTSKQTATTSTGPQRSATVTLQPTPTTITTACRQLAASRMLPVLCPTRLPEGRWFVNHRTLRDGRCAYLLDLNTHPFGRNIPFHALAGGRCGLWPLTTRGGRWPASGALTNDLGLIGAKPLRPGQPSTTTPTPAPPRVLRRVDVNGQHGLLLQEAAYPNGGVHGGHLAVIWNQDGNGYVLTLHFTESPRTPTSSWQQIVIDTAATMSRSGATRASGGRATGCPRTAGSRSAKGVAIALGRGPAYPVLGMPAAPPSPRGVAPLDDDDHKQGVYFHKTLWAISRRAPSDVLIRARVYSDHRPVDFYDGRRQLRVLRLPKPRKAWGYATTTTLLPGPGCYVFEVTGRGLQQQIVFQATFNNLRG